MERRQKKLLNIAYNVLQLYAVVCRLCAVGKLRIGAVMYQFIFYFFALAFNDLHNLTKIILNLFAESK